MKRYICAVLAAALLAPGMWAISARADDEGKASSAAETHEGGMPDHAKMVERMKKRLELTDDQAAKLTEAMKVHHQAMQGLWEKQKDAMKKLHEQLKAKAPDADIQTSLDSLKSAHKGAADEEEKFHESLGFLTATQRAKLLMGEMHMRREHEMHGMRGKHGPKGADKDHDEDEKEGD